MEVDHSDILGGPILQNSRENQSSWFSASNVILTVLGLLGLYIAGVQVWTRVLIWKEKSYKLAMRRRHGIPDNDHRPFNVAYAAVVLARQEQEAAARRAMLARPPVPQPTEPEQGVRQRQGTRREESSAALMSVPGRFEFPSDSGYSTGSSRAKGSSAKPFADRLNFEDRYNPNPGSRDNGSVYAQSSAARSRKASHKSLIKGDSRKRAFTADEDADLNDVKKSKYEHEEDALEEIAVPRRGYKRVASEDDEEDVEAYEAKRGREKRLRKISLEKSPQYDSEMDIYEEEEDHVPEMKSIVRGKKRDRAEAGSTFGGDEEDSDHEVEVDDQKSHRHRKRRNRRKSEGIPSRGKKRDRDVEEESSDLDSDEAQVKAARKKRGKKASPKVEADDVSMDESPAPSVGSGRVKRRIGEEWESNGVKFKIGPNGQRLRLTLVKKERQKFPMPMDSQHPDRQANLEVCIETWLTEQEYREAKENYRLAWQDASKSPSEPATPAATEAAPPSPKKGGKDLLWSSTASGLPTPQVSPPSTPAKANGFRQSILGGTPLTPFAQGQVSSKRIASAPRTSFSGYGSSYGSPSLNGKPQLTKWEKEEMEANAIMRLRRKKDEEKKKQEEEAKAAKEKAEQEKKVKEAAAAAAVPKAPAITITPPAEVKQADAKPAISLFGAPPTASQPATSQLPKAPLFGTAPQTDTKAPGSAAPAAPPAKPAGSLFDFAKPADSAPKPPPSLNFGAPAATSTAPSTGSSLKFSFSNPAATTAAPNAEEKKDIVSAPSSANPLFSRLGPQPSSTSQASSAAASTTPVFSFTNSAASEPPKQSASLFSAPAATVPAPAAPAATSNAAPKFSFGLDKTTAPAPASFGSTFGAPKATAPAPTSSSSLSGALGSETKPASTPSPSFSFQKPTSAGTTSTGSAFGTPTASGTSAPTFNFSGGSLFGGNKTDQKAPEADKPAAAAPSTPAKAPFSFPSSTGSNAASTAPATSSGLKFSFGAPAPASTGTSTDAPKSAFGGGFGASTTPATSSTEAPKPALGFGTTTTATPATSGFNFGTPSTSSEAPKPFGSFGGSSTPAATTSNDAPKTGFASFGSSATNGTTTNGEASKPPLFGGFSSNTSSSSPFGSGNAFGGAKTGEAAKTPAAFGFGTPASSATNGAADGAQKPALTLAFGAPAASTNGSGSAFNFGNGDAAKATAQPSGGSIFGGSSTANGSASPFGNFGAAGGFSFSKTPSTAGDK